MAGFCACEQIPDALFPIASEEINSADDRATTPQPQSSVEPFFAEEIQQSKTAYFESSPQADQCHMAIAGNPLDARFSEGTVLNPCVAFVKIWRIGNARDCAWTTDYSIVWFSGDDIGMDKEFRFSETVLPNEMIELSVEMIAPEIAGFYQIN